MPPRLRRKARNRPHTGPSRPSNGRSARGGAARWEVTPSWRSLSPQTVGPQYEAGVHLHPWARRCGCADTVVLSMHWGVHFYAIADKLVRRRLFELAKRLAEPGTDAVTPRRAKAPAPHR